MRPALHRRENIMDPMSKFGERDASDERARINGMKAVAMDMIQEMPDDVFVAWYNAAFVAMDEAATSGFNHATFMILKAEDKEIPF